MKIVTDNLVIREFALDDAGAYFKNNNEAQIKKIYAESLAQQ